MSSIKRPRKNYDISLVLNLHDETRFLRRTMLSFEGAVRYAFRRGLTVELIVVLDRPATSTVQWIDNYNFDVFDYYQIIEVDHGSLGLSRNSGIDLATGEYICTCDADDLISYNMLFELFLCVRTYGKSTIAFPQFLFAFGESYHMVEYFGTDKVSRLGFFEYNPYISRVFVHRSLFEKLRYKDVNLTTGFAYEDWHFNCEVLSLGYEFRVAKNTVFFYRQRKGSLLQKANSFSVGCIPFSEFFSPKTYLRVCGDDYDRYLRQDISRNNPENSRQTLCNDPLIIELIYEAQKIDPSIDVVQAGEAFMFSNLDGDLESGAAYFQIIKLLATEMEEKSISYFTDVLLLPFLTTGGGEKYILDVLSGISRIDPDRSFLVLTGESFEQHQWIDRLPERSIFLDLYRKSSNSVEIDAVVDKFTLRLIQAVASRSIVHLKSSCYSARFVGAFASLLPSNLFVYYRFTDEQLFRSSYNFTRGYSFQFLSEYGESIDTIVTDNEMIKAHDAQLLDTLSERTHCLYNRCSVLADEELDKEYPVKYRLLWASRLDSQKRPELLLKLAERLHEKLPQIRIDVYGSPVFDNYDVSPLSEHRDLEYKGGYSDFEMLPYYEYDAFLYTTRFDGLPNVILEALSAGLPVIAPDIGGIREAVQDGETGFLLNNIDDDDALIEAYVDACASLYSQETDLMAMRNAAIRLIKERHSEEAYLNHLGKIF